MPQGILTPDETAARLGRKPILTPQAGVLSPEETIARVSAAKATPVALPTPVAAPANKPATSASPESKHSFAAGAQEAIGLDPEKMAAAQKAGGSFGVLKESAKETAQGLGNWVTSVLSAKDNKGLFPGIQHITDPIVSAGKNTGTALKEIFNGIETGDSDKAWHGAGTLVGTYGPILAEEGLRAGPAKAATVGAAFQRKALVNAATQTVEDSANALKSHIDTQLKKVQQSVGGMVKDITTADEADLVAKQQHGFVTTNGIQNAAAQEITKVKTAASEIPQTKSFLKRLKAIEAQNGTAVNFNSLKDIRTIIDDEFSKASGKDRAILGKLYNDATSVMEQRSGTLGHAGTFTEYNDLTNRLREHRDGIVKELNNTKTGVKAFDVLSNTANKPRITSLFGDLSKYTSTKASLVDDVLKGNKATYSLARRASLPYSDMNRYSSIFRHPLMGIAGAAIGGTFPTVFPFSKAVTGTFGAYFAAQFADQMSAAAELQRLGGRSLVPFTQPARPPSGGIPFGGPTGPGAPPMPQTPTGPFGAAPTPITRGPSDVFIREPATSRATPQGATPSVPAALKSDLEKAVGRPLTDEQAVAIDRAKREEGMVTAADKSTQVREDYRTQLEKKGGEANGQEKDVQKGTSKAGQENAEGQKEITPSASATSSKVKKPKAYEKFGVVIDSSQWKTPEDVVAGKEAARNELQSKVMQRTQEMRKQVQEGTLDKDGAQKAVSELLQDHRKAVASINKIQTPDIGSKARDRLRKGGEAYDAFADAGREQTRREQDAGDVTADIEAGLTIDKYEKLFAQQGFKDLYDKISKAHFAKFDGEYQLLAKQLEAAYATITKARGASGL